MSTYCSRVGGSRTVSPRLGAAPPDLKILHFRSKMGTAPPSAAREVSGASSPCNQQGEPRYGIDCLPGM